MKTASTKIKDVDVIDIYQHFYNDNLETFRARCISLVEDARAPNRALLIQMKRMSKDQLVKSISNFFLKGNGLGVK